MMSTENFMGRNYQWLDRLLIKTQEALNAVMISPATHQENPSESVEESISQNDRKTSVCLMRVNHSGEVCAQALYEGQLLTARSEETRRVLEKAAQEEKDHLAWTSERIQELGGHRSYLNPFWYANSFLIGVLAGAWGDAWSLGFVEETERQVADHLKNHLHKLPVTDKKSQKIIERMREDEVRHGNSATSAGAKKLPGVVKTLMFFHAKVMTTLSFWI